MNFGNTRKCWVCESKYKEPPQTPRVLCLSCIGRKLRQRVKQTYFDCICEKMYSISFHHPVSEKNGVFRGWWRRFSVLSVCLFFTFVLVKTKARRQLDVERAHEGGRKRGREKEGERGTEGLLLSEFWGNSEKKVVFCSGVTLNKPITPRGALPSVCSRTPPPLWICPTMLRSVCHFSQKPSCSDFRGDKRTAEGG